MGPEGGGGETALILLDPFQSPLLTTEEFSVSSDGLRTENISQ